MSKHTVQVEPADATAEDDEKLLAEMEERGFLRLPGNQNTRI